MTEWTKQALSQAFRCHSANRGPLWFPNGGHGRFDLADPHGTCYTAESEQITLLETWGGMRVVPSTELTTRAITRLQVSGTRALADQTSNAAAQFGVTAEIFTTGNCQLTQRGHRHSATGGFAGIRYGARHDLAHTHACLALFDTASSHPSAGEDPPSYAVTDTETLTERPDLIHAQERDTGIIVLPVPPSL